MQSPAGRGSRRSVADTRTPAGRHRALSWAQWLKRVFGLDLETCEGCGGPVRVVACIEYPLVIAKILADLDRRAGLSLERHRPAARGPPPAGLDFG